MRTTRALVAVLVLSACSSTSSAPPQAATDAGLDAPAGPVPRVVHDPGVVSKDARSRSEHEPTVAATAGGRVLVAWIARAADRYKIGYILSPDHGATWGPVTYIEPETDFGAGDPIAAAGPNETLVLAWGSIRRDAQGRRVEAHLWLHTSPAGAKELRDPVEVSDPALPSLYDQPRVVFTPAGGLFYTYMRYKSETETDTAIVAARSANGRAFDRTDVDAGPGFHNMAFPCFARESSDKLWVRYFDENQGIALRRSDDGGRTFSEVVSVLAPEEKGRQGLTTPGCVARGADLWILYSVAVDGTDPTLGLAKARVAHSSDGGRTFDFRTDVVDAEQGARYLFPEIVMEDSGAIDVAYYAGKAAGDPAAKYVWARSTDGGRSFSTTAVVRDPLKLETGRTGLDWLGDYVGIAWTTPHLYLAFADNASGPSHIAFYRSTAP